MGERIGRGEAPAKAILLGEHAVVYGYPAIAVPLPQLRARAEAHFDSSLDDLVIESVGKGRAVSLRRDPGQPLALAAALAMQALEATPTNLRLRLESNIPIASGLGSGAAVSTAIMRALANLLGKALAAEQLSALVYEVEKLHHGTPSGIDNTVVVYGKPVYFRKGEAPEFLSLAYPLLLLLADTGEASLTREAVANLRQAREDNPEQVNTLLGRVGALVEDGRRALLEGNLPALGQVLTANHSILANLGVSSASLDRLVGAAGAAGALGAKMTGAGRGGHAIALVTADTAQRVGMALQAAGAKRVTLCAVECRSQERICT